MLAALSPLLTFVPVTICMPILDINLTNEGSKRLESLDRVVYGSLSKRCNH